MPFIKVKEVLEHEEIVVYRRWYGRFGTSLIYACPFLWPLLGLEAPWSEWDVQDNELYSKRNKLKKAIEKVDKLSKEVTTLEDELKARKKVLKGYQRGSSKEQRISVSWVSFFSGPRPNLDPCKLDWKDLLAQLSGAKSNKRKFLREKLGIGEHPYKDKGKSSAYTIKKHKEHLETWNRENGFPMDHTIAFIPDQNRNNSRKGKNNGNNQNQNNRNNQNNNNRNN